MTVAKETKRFTSEADRRAWELVDEFTERMGADRSEDGSSGFFEAMKYLDSLENGTLDAGLICAALMGLARGGALKVAIASTLWHYARGDYDEERAETDRVRAVEGRQ